MITVTITGDRGEGKTTVAMSVVAHLRSLGFDVKYVGLTEFHTNIIKGDLATGRFDPVAACHVPKAVEVIDRT